MMALLIAPSIFWNFRSFWSLKMFFTQPRVLLSTYGRRLWPSYRGKRAGRLVRARQTSQCYNISRVQPRQVNHGQAQANPRCHNPGNCIYIATNSCTTKVSEGQRKQSVPSLFLSNVMSLSPKMDEASHVVCNANFDLQSVAKLMTHLTVFGEFSSIPDLGKTSPPPPCTMLTRHEIRQTVFSLAVVRRSSRRFQNFAECVMSFATGCSSHNRNLAPTTHSRLYRGNKWL